MLLLGGAFRPRTAATGVTPLPEVGHPAPPFQLQDLSGRLTSLADLSGKVVMLNFWATWCGPCRIEMPEIQRLHERGMPDLAIVAVNMTDTERSPEWVAAFLQYFRFTFPVLLDRDGSVTNRYGIFAIPTTFFISPDGVIRVKHAGPMTLTAMLDGVAAARAPGGTTTSASPLLPDGFQVGSLPVSTANVLLILGAVLAYELATRTARRRGLDPGQTGDVIWLTAFGAFAGSRLLPALARPRAYLDNPWLLVISTGGPLALLGIALGAGAGIAWTLRHSKGQRLAIIEHLMAPACLGLAVSALGWPDPRGPVVAGGSALTAVLLLLGRRRAVPAGETLLYTASALATLGVVANLVWPTPLLWGGIGLAQWELATVAGLAYLAMLYLLPRLTPPNKEVDPRGSKP